LINLQYEVAELCAIEASGNNWERDLPNRPSTITKQHERSIVGVEAVEVWMRFCELEVDDFRRHALT
jgi:hypothetical protein